MTVAEIIPAAGLRRVVASLLETVRIGVRRFWPGGLYANASTGESTSLLNGLTRLLRLALLIAATQLTLAPARTRMKSTPRRHTYRPPQACLRLFPAMGVRYADAPKGPPPKALLNAGRDAVLIAERKRATLLRVLADPFPVIRRIARRLPHQLVVFGWRPPKRRPARWSAEFWDQAVEAWREAHFQIRAWRRRTWNMAEGAPA
jgi:hypothetical protein